MQKVTLRHVIEAVTLTGALFLLIFCFDGVSERRMMLAFTGGTASGLTSAPSHADAAEGARDGAPLRLLGHSYRQEYGYQMCEGEVRNMSGERLENVEVEVLFQDKAGSFIRSEEALVDYQPLLPGQTSPWKVGTMHNPLIRHYTIHFKQMFRGELKAVR